MKFYVFVILFFAMPIEIFASPTNPKEAVIAAINDLGIDAYMDWISSKEQQSMPYKKDSLDTLLSVSYAKGTKNRILRHQLVNNWRSMIASKKNITEEQAENLVKASMERLNRNYICSTDINTIYLENGVVISDTYNEENGTFIFSTSTGIDDCKRK
jgi:hypothetical protein